MLLPFDAPIGLGSYVIDALCHLAIALLLRSQKSKQPGDVKHAIKYLRYLQDQSLETSDLTRNDIKAFSVWALAVHVELRSVDRMRDIGEMASLCRELLRSGVQESLLVRAVKSFTSAICGTAVLYGQPLADGAIECLREARIRLPDLDGVRFTLAYSLFVHFNWAYSHDDYEEAMSVLDELIADPNEDVELAMTLARMLPHLRFFTHDSKPEHLAEAIFRTRTYLDAMSSEDPERRTVMEDLANLEKRRFEEFGSEVVDKKTLPEREDAGPHIRALISVHGITDRTNIEKGIEYCRLCLTSPHSHLPLAHLALGHLLQRVFNLTGNIDSLQESITLQRHLIKMPGVPINLHTTALQLIDRLLSRFKLFKDRRDIGEIMEY
ncbi:hypothetical protein BJV74DRAFT_952706 [Russula compacta]|nr:hypothetical protein BJV74DRAFT_952706 [Russula compacta]